MELVRGYQIKGRGRSQAEQIDQLRYSTWAPQTLRGWLSKQLPTGLSISSRQLHDKLKPRRLERICMTLMKVGSH